MRNHRDLDPPRHDQTDAAQNSCKVKTPFSDKLSATASPTASNLTVPPIPPEVLLGVLSHQSRRKPARSLERPTARHARDTDRPGSAAKVTCRPWSAWSQPSGRYTRGLG